MAKLASGANPNPTPGRKVQPGVISGIARRTPQEITGGNGVQVQQVGNRLIIKGNAGRGGSGLSITPVLTLPPIPSSGARIVFWTSAGAGTGDDQMWMAFAGQTEWTAMQFATTLSGVPV